jgi:hypothetical protein
MWRVSPTHELPAHTVPDEKFWIWHPVALQKPLRQALSKPLQFWVDPSLQTPASQKSLSSQTSPEQNSPPHLVPSPLLLIEHPVAALQAGIWHALATLQFCVPDSVQVPVRFPQ